jgi:flagellar biosynthesis chaperone FliJ
MENIKNMSNNAPNTATPNQSFEKTKAYQDFINVLSQIIEKHGAEVLGEINRAN